MASYTFRTSTLTKPETWKTTPQGLTLNNDGVNESHCPYQNIKLIRLLYYPTRMKPNNYLCKIYFNSTQTSMKIPSISYVSFANFEDKANEYNEFVKELLENTAQQNPNCKFYAGKPVWTFILENLLVIAIIGFIFLILNFIGKFSPSTTVIFRFILIAYSLFYLVKAFIANWPKKINLNEIPPKVLPSL